MSTHKESPESFLEQDFFADVIYKHHVFDIPKMIDICALFAKNNRKIVAKMLENIFSQQNLFWKDLEHFANETLCQILASVAGKCGYDIIQRTGSPKRLGVSAQGNRLLQLKLSDIQELLDYTEDLGISLFTFFDVFAPAASVFFQNGGHFLQTFVSFYEHLSTGFAELFRVTVSKPEIRESKQSLKKQWNTARIHLLQVLHQVIQFNLITPLLDGATGQQADDLVDTFFQVMSLIVSERHLARDYDKVFPFEEACEVLMQLPLEIDVTRIDFVREGFSGAKMKEPNAKQIPTAEAVAAEVPLPAAVTSDPAADQAVGASSKQLHGVELDSLITTNFVTVETGVVEAGCGWL